MTMRLLVAALAAAGLSGCVAYADPYYGGGPGYSPPYSSAPYYSGSISYGQAPYVVQPAPIYLYGGRGWDRHWRGGRDRDHDGIPNRWDRDRDGDGVPNRLDAWPNDPRRH